MAIFHASVKTYSRAEGHSAVAAAAYRAGRRLLDDRTGLTHDYRQRTGVAAVSMHAADDAPAWANDLESVWNQVEAVEKRSNSRVARELEVALPAELTDAERRSIAHELARHLVERYRVAVLAAVHQPDDGGDPRNHHVHLLFSTRVLGPEGFGEKVRVLDDRTAGPKEVRALRQMVADCLNRHLEVAQRPERVHAGTLEAQACAAAERGDLKAVAVLTRSPTKHLGKAAAAAKRGGRHSSRATRNAVVLRNNAELQAFAQQWAQAIPVVGWGESEESKLELSRPTHRGRTHHEAHVGRSRLSKPIVSLSGPGGSLRQIYGADLSQTNRLYLEALAETVRNNHDTYIDAQKQEARMNQQLALQRELAASRQRAYEAQAQASAAKEAWALVRKERGEAMVRTGEAEAALKALDVGKPSALRVLNRRQWAKKRREQAQALEQARVSERKLHARASELEQTVEDKEHSASKARAVRNALCEQAKVVHETAGEGVCSPESVPAQVEKPRAQGMELAALSKKNQSSP